MKNSIHIYINKHNRNHGFPCFISLDEDIQSVFYYKEKKERKKKARGGELIKSGDANFGVATSLELD